MKRAGLTAEQLEVIRAKDRAIKAAIPLEDKRAYNATWRDTVSEEWREAKRVYNRERYRQQRDRLNAQNAAHRHGPNRERILQRYRDYYRAHRAEAIAKQVPHTEARRVRLQGCPTYRVTRADWRRMVRRFDGLCAYCGTKPERLTKDHVIPVVRGGSHSIGNIVPACDRCNKSKGPRTVMEWRVAVLRAAPVSESIHSPRAREPRRFQHGDA